MKKRKRGQHLQDEEKVFITNEEMKHIQNCLRWGHKGELANQLEISQPTLTQLFKKKPIYNKELQVFEDKYLMPKSLYEKTLKFIEII